jgi:hypothetical protein
MIKKNTKLLSKFKRLPKSGQKELEVLLFEKQAKINDDKWTLVLDSVYSMMSKFLKKYNRIRDREVALEERTILVGKQYGFSLKQLLNIKTEMVKDRYNTYLKKKNLL